MRIAPSPHKLRDCISHAEELWDGLTKNGYGETKATTPRESKNWIEALTGTQRTAFDAFWNAFDYKKDRNGAAMRWGQLGELPRESYQAIISAAKAEALRPLAPGIARKMAQGWLYEMRWLDYNAAPADSAQQSEAEYRRELGALTHIRMLFEMGNDPEVGKQVQALENKVKALREKRGEQCTDGIPAKTMTMYKKPGSN